MSNNSGSSSGGIGILGLMFIGLFFAKILGVDPVAAWSWWWVTAPLWGPVTVVCAGLVLWFFGALAFQLWLAEQRKKKAQAAKLRSLH